MMWRSLFLTFLAIGSCLAQSGAPAGICNDVAPDETDFKFHGLTPGPVTTPTADTGTINCNNSVAMTPNNPSKVCVETTLDATLANECTVVKVDGVVLITFDCQALGAVADLTKNGTFKSVGAEDITVTATAVMKNDATSKCTTVQIEYTHGNTTVDNTLAKFCSCLDASSYQVNRLTPLATDLCTVANHGADPKLEMNNELAAPMEKCENVTLENAKTAQVCVSSQRTKMFEECTTVKIDGVVSDLGFPCEKLGDDFKSAAGVKPYDSRTPAGDSHSSFSNCTVYDGTTICVESVTEPEGKCVTVAKGANEAAAVKVFQKCFCLKLNEFLVKTLKTPSSCPVKTVADDDIQIHFIGTNPFLLPDEGEFDNTYINGKPADVELGSLQFMRGWDIALVGMCVGEVRQITIPRSHYMTGEILTYPTSPHPFIHEEDTLVFEVLLVKIVGDKTEL